MYSIRKGVVIVSWLLFCSCSKNPSATAQITPPVTDSFLFAKGADIGWLSQMEANGYSFYDSDGTKKDCLAILKLKGINAIRLRVWVDPTDGWCGLQDVITQSVRAVQLGMKLMIDFHYSDSWADPGKQTKPKAWASLNPSGLTGAVYQHTKEVMRALQNKGITPAWVQIGNETNDGMLWEDGRASKNMAQFAGFIKAGYQAVKEVSPDTKIVVHISNGYDNALFRWIFDGLVANQVSWDIIGMSLYPSASGWQLTNSACYTNMKDMVSRYGKEIMICEVGMDVAQAESCRLFLKDLILKIQSLPKQKGLGIFYWEPESYKSWQGYRMGAFDDTGKPTVALNAFNE